MLEVLITIVLFGFVIVLTVFFYLSGGGYNAWINYGAPVLLLLVVLCRRLVSPETFMLWFLAVSWLFYLIATNLFTRCITVRDFLSAYRPTYVRIITSIFVVYAAVSAIKSFGAESGVVLAITLILWFSYANLLSHMRGDTGTYKTCLSCLACLWMVLVAVLGNGRVYEIQDGAWHSMVTWQLLTNGELNLVGFESIANDIVIRYLWILSLSYSFFICGVLYHGLLHHRARPVALRSYAIVLILMIYHFVPEIRTGLRAIPEIGRYLSSPIFLLAAVTLTMVLIVIPRRKQ